MSARQLVISENSTLDFIENPNTGKWFFACGTKRGYVSPAAKDKIKNGGTIEDFQYAEVSIDGNDAVPCLMVVGDANKNRKACLGESLLR